MKIQKMNHQPTFNANLSIKAAKGTILPEEIKLLQERAQAKKNIDLIKVQIGKIEPIGMQDGHGGYIELEYNMKAITKKCKEKKEYNLGKNEEIPVSRAFEPFQVLLDFIEKL